MGKGEKNEKRRIENEQRNRENEQKKLSK